MIYISINYLSWDIMAKNNAEKVQEAEEALARKYEEEVLNRKAKAGLHADACTTPLKMAKGHMRRKPLIKQVTCQKCGKIFKTNRNTKFCFKCEKMK